MGSGLLNGSLLGGRLPDDPYLGVGFFGDGIHGDSLFDGRLVSDEYFRGEHFGGGVLRGRHFGDGSDRKDCVVVMSACSEKPLVYLRGSSCRRRG